VNRDKVLDDAHVAVLAASVQAGLPALHQAKTTYIQMCDKRERKFKEKQIISENGRKLKSK
jgi:hypothetical protein